MHGARAESLWRPEHGAPGWLEPDARAGKKCGSRPKAGDRHPAKEMVELRTSRPHSDSQDVGRKTDRATSNPVADFVHGTSRWNSTTPFGW
jgi:hypothetical protein